MCSDRWGTRPTGRGPRWCPRSGAVIRKMDIYFPLFVWFVSKEMFHLVEKRVQEGEEPVSEVEGVTRGGGNGVAEHGRVLSKFFKKCCHCYRY